VNNVLRISALSIDEGDFEDEDDSSDDARPMFSHECFASSDVSPNTSCSPDEPAANPKEPNFGFPDSHKPKHDASHVEDRIDYNDPRLEQFPHESRRSIIAELQRIETSTEPDWSLPEGIPPPSPVFSPLSSSFPTLLEPEPSSRRTSAPRAALGSIHSVRSQLSLASIDETAEDEPESRKADKSHSHPAAPPPGMLDVSDYGGLDMSRKPALAAVHQVEPPTPIVRLEAPSEDEDEGISLSTGNSTEKPGPGQLRKRETKNPPERDAVAAFTHSAHETGKQSNWLQSLFRVLFVSVGHFFSNILFGNKRKA
jgi:hypothetical protein